MLTTDRFLPGLRGPATIAIFSAALVLLPGSTLAVDSNSAELEAAPDAGDLVIDGADLVQLQEQLDALSERNLTLETDNSKLVQAVEDVTRERDRLQDSLTRFDELYDPFEADRQLLFELRKGMPETRAEAEAQVGRLQRLALSSDPSRLGQLVDRVSDTAPAFFDWRFTQFGSAQEASAAYIDTGANAFESSMEDLQNAVLLTVANRIDGLLTVLDRTR